MEVLEDAIPKKAISSWPYGLNDYLGGDRPIDLLRKKQYQRVYDLAADLKYGLYP